MAIVSRPPPDRTAHEHLAAEAVIEGFPCLHITSEDALGAQRSTSFYERLLRALT